MSDKVKKNSFFVDAYDDIYNIGDVYRRIFSLVGKKVLQIIVAPFKLIGMFLAFLYKKIAKFIVRCVKYLAREAKQFSGEIKRAFPIIKEKFKEKPSLGIKKFFGYVFHAFSTHKGFNRNIVNALIPLCAVIVLLSLINTVGGVTFALNVTINGKNVGTVKNESVFREAENEAKKRFQTVGTDVDSGTPVYKITVTTMSGIDDKETVCDNIIFALSDSTVNACGIYVNGKFLCAVSSQDTFDRVAASVLDDYANADGNITDDVNISFIDKITTSAGLYPDNEKIWTASELYDYMAGNKTEAVEHKYSKEDSLQSVLDKYKITEKELLTLNPELDVNDIPEGSTLLIKKAVRNMSVKATVTYISNEIIPYSTVKQYDNNLYIGTTMTVVPGSSGQDVVSYTDTYEDGVLVSSKRELVRYNAKSAVNELLKVGTKGIPVDNSDAPVSPRLLKDQGGTFIWPAPDNCFWLSRGYNSGNAHYGIDIVSSDNGSCRGRRITAVADGVVVTATYHYSWGYYIRVDHGDGVVTGYAHALEGSFRVNVGDYVKAGQQLSSIGTTGNSTGYHLHFEVWLDGTRVDPLPYVYSELYGVAVG